MILLFVLVGFVAGTVCAAYTLATGGGILAAVLAYSVFGAIAVVITAILTAIGPTLMRPKAASGIPVRVPAHRR
ncbi:MAG: hypothetical protein KDK10_04785 [Maritimibacter sp.]|nr:hypothetical protein [Maritimibacter sp.]